MSVVTVRRQGAAAIIALNRPDSLNACDVATTHALLAALDDVRRDDAVRAVCLTGTGRAFCSGVDLGEVDQQEAEVCDGRPDLQRALVERFNPITVALREMPKPVLAAVNGPCAGVGVSFALACDMVIAAESAFFMLAFVKLGLAPDGGASAFLQARCGPVRTAQLAMSGRRVPASEALAIGLIDETAADATFESRVAAVMEELASGPTQSYVRIKQQANAWLYRHLDDQLALEAEHQQQLVGTDDFAEGLRSFHEKRSPSFTGR